MPPPTMGTPQAGKRASHEASGTKLVGVSATRVFVARLAGCPVFDPNGERVGKARDVLVVYLSLIHI